MKKMVLGILCILLPGCTGLPKNVTPVQDFDSNQYLGKWYEIARLDHSFERGLDNVSATYSLREDGGIDVLNRGYSTTENTWKTATGKAYFVNDRRTGHLKVSFFGPIYSSYVIFHLDKEKYQYAFISGYSNSYLWLLARATTVDKTVTSKFIEMASNRGFDTDKLIFVHHD